MIGVTPPPGALLPDSHVNACTERVIRAGIREHGGVILGRALLEGRFSLAEALAC